MTKIKLFMMLALLMVGVMTSVEVKAQVQWKGHDYNELVSSSGTEVFLYNVGTGRFLIHGGDWGIQARLFYNNSGKVLTLKYGQQGTNIIFDTGMTTLHEGQYANNLGCNPPKVTASDDWYSDSEYKLGACFSVIMDSKELIGDGSASNTYRNWHFIRVEDPSNTDTYTYYMYETLGSSASTHYAANTDFYMGAVYGENGEVANGVGHEGDPIGKLALLSSSYDKVTWTTVDPLSTTSYSNGLKSAEKAYLGDITSIDRSMSSEVRIYGGVDIELRKLYQWRIVTKEELVALATSQEDTGSGLDINLTYLIQDRGMERNDFAFFEGDNTNQDNAWIAKPFTDNIYSTDGEGRHRYTWGYLSGVKSTSSKTLNTATSPLDVDGQNYKYPVRLKAQWDNKIDAKYGYMEFEGVGTASTYIEAPATGTYKIAGYGFYRGNPAYLFATTADPATLSLSDLQGGNINEFEKVTNNYDKSTEGSVTKSGDTYTKTGVMGGGYDFVYNKTDYRREVEINVNRGDKIYLGVAKFAASKSGSDASSGGTTVRYITYTSGGNTYYLNAEGKFVTDTKTVWETNSYNEVHCGDVYLYFTTSGNTRYLTTTTYSGLGSNYGVRANNQGRLYVSSTYYLTGNTTGETPTFSTSTTNAASYSSGTTSGTNYYHDTDWVGVDQFEITYLGTDPVMFDEDKESLNYLMEEGSNNQYTDKQYTNQSVRLHREFVKGDWNTFVFPLNLSADQIRNGFGDETLLAELVDLGQYTRRADCIDFNIVPLPSGGTAVTGGKLYLIKPENDPKETSDGVTYYDLGRQSFNTADFEGIETVHYGVADGDDIEYRDENRNGVTTFACYYRTSGYENISGNIISNPSSISNGVYVPKHSYVIGQDTQHNGAKMYWTANNLKVKGFRGWLVDGDKTGSSNGAKFYLGGIFDNGETTGIGFIPVSDKPSKVGNNAVYDLSGRKVGTADDTNRLPKGLYIVNGKKYIVK